MNTVRQRLTATKTAFSSWEGFKKAALVEPSEGYAADGKAFSWSNAHMDPTPIPERTWKWWNFASIWMAYGFSPGVWALGSSMIKAGLTPGQAICCIFLAHLFGAIMIVFNSRFGATYHMGFPVYSRISFGMWGSFFPILLRCALGILWVGVLVYQGGYFTNIMLRCVFGHKWTDIENTIPSSSGTTSRLLLSAILFWIVTVPACFLPMHKTRFFWAAKCIVLPPCVIGLFIYTQLIKRDTSLPAFPDLKRVHGSELSWLMLAMINSAMGKTSSLQANQPDLARYAFSRSSPALSQFIALPVFNTVVSCLGIFATSAVYKAWGVAYWNSWDLLNAVLDHNWNAGARCAVFLCAGGWALSCFVSNIAANVMPFGADITALFPRIMDINRGQFFAYCIGIVLQPWYILATATTFLSFLGGYSVFFGPVAGISAVDYFFARRGNVDVPSCFNGAKHAPFMYEMHGFNPRAFIAYICGLAPTLPGFAGTLGHKVPIGATHIFQFGWLFSICTSSLVYFLLCLAFPHSTMRNGRASKFEQFADDQQALLDRDTSVTSRGESLAGDSEKESAATAAARPVNMAV